ncbi:DNA-binding transcriptional ArsR family regulator [Pseudarthrobacter defluvii]|uniref:winged helix-turn-helix domain-containing protein n=1 Tax=Pseudarthrobacter defluvii TaxID=410837 RepID=UPI002781E6AF|nr:helix-turn-helix domain-containing protein [Pseudarthrobacter defluvii]MDQ0769526.1 DNA-binding transcriptional ArsR family regulator [Pseudarthrobacter defluvii]
MANIMMHRTRSQIIRFLIAHGPATCHDVAAALNVPPPSLHSHFALLREAGILTLASERYEAEVEEIQRQHACLAAELQPSGTDGKNGAAEVSHNSMSQFPSEN